MKKTKLVALFITIAMLFSNFIFVYAIEKPIESFEKPTDIQNGEQIVPVIIEMSSLPLLENPLVESMGYKKFLNSPSTEKLKSKLLNDQTDIQNIIINTIFKDAKFGYSYTNTLNGFSAKIRAKDIDSIMALKGVKNVYLDELYELPTPQMSSSNDMINTPDLWKIGLKGEGTVIAVIDSGFDVDHELMAIADSTNAKLGTNEIDCVISKLNASKLVQGLKSTDVYSNKKFPYCFDYADKDIDPSANRSTHGVHVAGIVAANGTIASQQNNQLSAKVIFDGVAPEAQIIGMKVFSDFSDSAKTSDILAAVEDSITIGVDAINLSLGSSAGFTLYKDIKKIKAYEYEFSFLRARKAGIIVSASAGNSNRIGQKSIWDTNYGYQYPTSTNPDVGLVGSPSVKAHATSVASVENSYYYANIIKHISEKQMAYSDNKTNFSTIFNRQTLDYVYCGYGTLQDFTQVNVQGKIALIQRGSITFVEKMDNAANNGAAGVIIFNNKANGDALVNMVNNAAKTPSIFIGYNNGMFLVNSTDKRVYVEEGLLAQFKNPLGYQMSDFTSWGCTPDLKLKPELTAPGGSIYSTTNNNTYQTMSGTSMASPHIAGAAALLKQYVDSDVKFKVYGEMEKSNIIEKLLMSTATILEDKFGDEYSPRRQGAGLANLEAAVKTNVYLTNLYSGKSKIELGDNLGDNFNIEFDVINLSKESYKYEINSSIFTDSIGDSKSVQFILPYIQAFERANITVSGRNIADNILSVNPYSVNHVVLNVSLDATEVAALNNVFTNGFFVEGFVKLLAMDDQPDLNIPYMGFYGMWNQAPIFDGSLRYDENLPFYANSYAYDYAYDANGEPYAYYILGNNAISNAFNYNWIAFSPNSDRIYDNMGMRLNQLRNARAIFVNIENNKGQIINSILDETYYPKTYYYSNGGYLTTEDLPLWDGTDFKGDLVEDGQYYYTIVAKIDENSNANYQTWKIPVFLDTTSPTIGIYTYTEVDKKLTISINDNHLLTYIAVTDGVNIQEMPLAEPTATLDNLVFDLSQFTGNTVTIHIEDCAGNIIEQQINLVPVQ